MIIPFHVKSKSVLRCAITILENNELKYWEIGEGAFQTKILNSNLKVWDYGLIKKLGDKMYLFVEDKHKDIAKGKFKKFWSAEEKLAYESYIDRGIEFGFENVRLGDINFNILYNWVMENLMYNTGFKEMREIKDALFTKYAEKRGDVRILGNYGVPPFNENNIKVLIREHNILKFLE